MRPIEEVRNDMQKALALTYPTNQDRADFILRAYALEIVERCKTMSLGCAIDAPTEFRLRSAFNAVREEIEQKPISATTENGDTQIKHDGGRG